MRRTLRGDGVIMKTTLITTVACSLAVLATIGLAGPALAATPPAHPRSTHTAAPRDLSRLQAAGQKLTAARIVSLGKVIPKITANRYLTTSDRSKALGILTADLGSMKTLQSKIAADTALATAKTDVKSICSGYRVYAVAIPQAHAAASSDALTSAAMPRLVRAQTALAAALAGKDKSKDTAAIDAKMTDLSAQIATVRSSAPGIAAAALAVTPAAYDANHAVLTDIRGSLKAAATAAKAARADVKAVRAALR
jgi:hypothetical protein